MSELADLLERFRRGPELLAVVTTGAAGPELDFRSSEDAWSVRMIACHLADAEAVTVMRMRQIIAEENPNLQSWDEKAWSKNLDYQKRKISQALDTFRRLRGENHELVKELPETAFTRSGHHTERGTLSLLDIVRGNAEHLESHVKQIQRVRAAYKESRTKPAGTA